MYQQRITSKNPGAIIFLIDQSASMNELIRHENRFCTKAELVARFVNFSLEEIIDSSSTFNEIKPYLNIAVLAYGDDSVVSLLHKNKDFLTPSEIANIDCQTLKYSFMRTMPNGKDKLFTCLENCWIKPHAEGSTPMGKVLDYATRLAARWCNKHPESFAPVVINLTDGEKTDCHAQELIAKAEKLKQVSTNDGELIFMNIHIGNLEDKNCGLLFPEAKDELPEKAHAELLYEISSTLPKQFNSFVRSLKSSSADASGFKAMTFNLSGKEFFSILKIGTITISSQT